MTKKTIIIIAAACVFLLISVLLFATLYKKQQQAEPASEESAQTGSGISLPVSDKSSSAARELSEIKESTVSGQKPEEIISDTIREKYGTSSYDTLIKYPEIQGLSKKIKEDFDVEKLRTSAPPRLVKVGNGKEIVILIGCAPHNCGGTENIIAYDQQESKVYILAENSTQTDYALLGNPPEEIKSLLIYYYIH